MKLEEEIKQNKFKSEYHKAAVNLIYTHNWSHNSFSAELKKFGITIQQFNVLRILRGQHPKPVSIKVVKERMLDKMSDASRIVEKLRMKGLVLRSECPSDRRNVDIVITEQGLKLLSKMDELDSFFISKFNTLSESEVLQLNLLLDKLRG